MNPSDEDERLIARICGNDEEALMLLMQKYYIHLCQFSRSLLDRHELAEEAAANVFISLWQRRAALVIRTSLRSYLFSAVAHQSISLRAKAIRTAAIPLQEVPPSQLVDGQQADSELLYREFQTEIESLIERMPRQRQTIFRMNRIENRRYKEIASLLGLSEHTVKNQLVKAHQQIEESLPRLRGLLGGNPIAD